MWSKAESDYHARLREGAGGSAARPRPSPRREETAEERADGIAKTQAWREAAGITRQDPEAALPAHRMKVRTDLQRMHRDRILREYAEAGLAVPKDSDQNPVVSLPMLFSMGYTIQQAPDGGRVLLKPDHPPPLRRSMGY